MKNIAFSIDYERLSSTFRKICIKSWGKKSDFFCSSMYLIYRLVFIINRMLKFNAINHTAKFKIPTP